MRILAPSSSVTSKLSLGGGTTKLILLVSALSDWPPARGAGITGLPARVTAYTIRVNYACVDSK
jgi:hypothetical protein